jgi:hypothetical protein
MSNGKKEITLIEFLIKVKKGIDYLFKMKIVILLFCFVGGCLGVLRAYLTKPVYISELTFVSESEAKGSVGGYAAIAAQFGIDLGGGGNGAFEGENLMEMLKSNALVYSTLFSKYDENDSNSKLIIERYISNNKMDRSWEDNARYKNLKFDGRIGMNRDADSITGKIYTDIVTNKLSVEKKDKKLNFISMSMKDGNEEFAKRFVEILANNSINYYTSYKSSKSRKNVELLQKEADSLRRLLFGNLDDAAEMGDLNVNPVRLKMRTGIQQKQVDIQTSAALYTEVLKNLQISKIALRKETPFIQIIDKPILPLKKEKPGRLITGIIYAFAAGILSAFFLLFIKQYKKFKQAFNESK